MTIDEFEKVLEIGGIHIVASIDWRKQVYDAFLNQDKIVFAPRSPIFTGHTKKAAIKKLKEWYFWEARNANRR